MNVRFMMFFMALLAAELCASSAEAVRRIEPLESFELEDLVYVGFEDAHGFRSAQILAPDNSLHQVSVGNFLGRNHGRIHVIKAEEILLFELYPDDSGDWHQRPASLRLLAPGRRSSPH